VTSLPTDAEIRAKAEALGLIQPGADLPHEVRRAVAKGLLEETQQPEPPATPPGILLSRSSVQAPGVDGILQIDVIFIPNKKETPHG
jgi:hypothetical protein